MDELGKVVFMLQWSAGSAAGCVSIVQQVTLSYESVGVRTKPLLAVRRFPVAILVALAVVDGHHVSRTTQPYRSVDFV